MLSDEDKKWLLENFGTPDRLERVQALIPTIRGEVSDGQFRALEARLNAIEERLHNLEQKAQGA